MVSSYDNDEHVSCSICVDSSSDYEDGKSITSVQSIDNIDSGVVVEANTESDIEFINEEPESDDNDLFIDNDTWNIRIQDPGCEESQLKAKCYARNKVMGVGPKENKLFYYHLTAIAVDLNKIIRDKFHSSGWKKVPKNSTQVK